MEENNGYGYNSDLQFGMGVTLDWIVQAEGLKSTKNLRQRGTTSVVGNDEERRW